MAKKQSPKNGKGAGGGRTGVKQQFASGVPMSRRPPRQPGR